SRTRCVAEWRSTSCDEARHPVSRAARELQLRLRVLPVREAARLARAARRRSRSVAPVRRSHRTALRGHVRYPRHAVGRSADAARAIRAALPADTYVWINAVKALAYSAGEIAAWQAIDPLFRVNLERWPSQGRACGAGERAITVDGEGTMRRCHFIEHPIGNF